MKYMLRLHAGEYDPWSFAFVELAPELLQLLHDARQHIKPLMAAFGSSFLSIRLMEYSPEFVEAAPPEFEQYEEEAMDQEYVRLPNDAELPEGERRDICHLIVEEDGFYWESSPKHVDALIETARLPFKELGL